MSDLTRTTLSNEDQDREATAQELAEVPTMTQAEMLKVMKSPEYRSSKLVRQLIAASIAKAQPTTPEVDRAPWHTDEEIQTGDEIAAKQAAHKALFTDKRYKTDAMYRLEVQKKLAEMTPVGETLPDNALAPSQTVRVNVSASPYRGADLRVGKFHRVEYAADGTEAPAKKQKPEPFADWK